MVVTFYAADFETGDGGLTPSQGWAWGATPRPAPHSPTKVWGTALDGNYTNSVQWTLTTQSISLPTAAGAELRFWQWYEIEDSYDGGNIKVAVDGGSFALVTPDPNYNDQTITAFGDTPGFTGSAGWHEIVVDLTPFPDTRWRSDGPSGLIAAGSAAVGTSMT